MKVSVIICTYNYARFLPQCLESVLSQTRMPDEIIVVDDGSTDETPEVVKRYEGVHYIRQDHAGKAAAFNKGLEVATGDIICHLDADDWWFDFKVQRIVETFLRFPSAAGVLHDAVIIKSEDERIPNKFTENGSPYLLKLREGILSAFLYLSCRYRKIKPYRYNHWEISPFIGGISIKREVLKDYYPLPSTINLSVDGLLYFVALTYGLIYLPEVLCVYRHHGANYWGSNPRSLEGQIALYEWLLTHEVFSKFLTNKDRLLMRAKLSEDTMVYELHGGMRKDYSLRVSLPLRLLAVGVLPGWKHWAFGLAFPLVKLLKKLLKKRSIFH